MSEKRDNIYIYLWENLNTVYVGRTVNPKSRHYQHRHNQTEKTYQFSSEHGLEHPKMIIVEKNLTIEEGVEREKYWINKYRENSTYNVLNKTEGGQVGKGKMCTLNDIKEHQKEYRSKNRELLNSKSKKYYHTHKKSVQEYQKKYRNSHKDERKKYLETNREYLLEQKREYYKKYRETHKDEINQRMKKYRSKDRT